MQKWKRKKGEVTKNKNEIEENLKRKIGPLIFCSSLYILLIIISKLVNRSWGRPKGSFFNRYYTEV